jgi:uncharacterized protein (DUF1697 family)
MNRFVGLVRGVNVGGKNTLPMAYLRDALDKTSFYGITTYIHSGNLVFNSKLDAAACEAIIVEVLKVSFGLVVPVIVKEQAFFSEVLNGNPFKSQTLQSPKFMNYGFLKEIPSPDKVAAIAQSATDLERFEIINDVLYFYSNVGLGATKMTNNFFEKNLEVVCTMRNHNTTLKLVGL